MRGFSAYLRLVFIKCLQSVAVGWHISSRLLMIVGTDSSKNLSLQLMLLMLKKTHGSVCKNYFNIQYFMI